MTSKYWQHYIRLTPKASPVSTVPPDPRRPHRRGYWTSLVVFLMSPWDAGRRALTTNTRCADEVATHQCLNEIGGSEFGNAISPGDIGSGLLIGTSLAHPSPVLRNLPYRTTLIFFMPTHHEGVYG
ncbi:hypothetical protein M404DRAFT_825321 [Pisolithus tinctorius Marx 270]|uniref:Uncharacterized protein n=1 Tax=Pisolithus tinctorius Marx 270 TaxID=870435 RepID=A0A0C3NTW5_PISTI|nr:hypothetical protein M404DRAFT_825321 [Pisolithus tinctorius Marx 270]